MRMTLKHRAVLARLEKRFFAVTETVCAKVRKSHMWLMRSLFAIERAATSRYVKFVTFGLLKQADKLRVPLLQLEILGLQLRMRANERCMKAEKLYQMAVYFRLCRLDPRFIPLLESSLSRTESRVDSGNEIN